MDNIKWKYDKKSKSWWTIETKPYANDGFDIYKSDGVFHLKTNLGYAIHFKKLSSAKTVANLLRHG